MSSKAAATALLCLVLGACAQAPTSAPPAAPQPAPRSAIPVAPVATATVYQVVRPASELRMLVMKGGILSRFGHNHVIGGPVISGRVMVQENLSRSSFQLDIDLAALEIDNPDWRQEEGADFASTPSAEDIAGTHENMLGEKVLDIGKYPTASIESVGILGQLPEFSVLARVTLKGKSKSIPVPVRLDLGVGQLTASGEFTLTQSDFGIEPFSILLGAISVQDDIRIRYRIVANPAD